MNSEEKDADAIKNKAINVAVVVGVLFGAGLYFVRYCWLVRLDCDHKTIHNLSLLLDKKGVDLFLSGVIVGCSNIGLSDSCHQLLPLR